MQTKRFYSTTPMMTSTFLSIGQNPHSYKLPPGLFTVDAVPSQLINAPARFGEHLLYIAVLRDALHNVQRYTGIRNKTAQRIRAADILWLNGKLDHVSDCPRSYVLDALSINPEWFTARVDEWVALLDAGKWTGNPMNAFAIGKVGRYGIDAVNRASRAARTEKGNASATELEPHQLIAEIMREIA